MTAAASSMSLLVKVQTPRANVDTARLYPDMAASDAEARQLAAAISLGDEAAFRTLYDRYERRLFRLALVLTQGDESTAHDAVQAAFIIAARKLRRVESADHLWNWLSRVTRQQTAKSSRRRSREAAVAALDDLPECPAAERSDSLLEECLDAALRSLAHDEREVIEWFYFDALSHKEIADRLQATPKAVSSRLERARAKLRSEIARALSHET